MDLIIVVNLFFAKINERLLDIYCLLALANLRYSSKVILIK